MIIVTFQAALLFFVQPGCGERDIVVPTSVRCMYGLALFVRALFVRPDMSWPSLLHLCMDFIII